MRTLLNLTLIILLTGCSTKIIKTRSSVVDYLYPESAEETIHPSTPILKLPLKVGVAFVPGGDKQLNSVTQHKLLERVADNFSQYRFIDDIQIIPSYYLKRGGSFTNLDQIKTMYDVDVIALVSYDQIQFTDQDFLSFTYWTVIGSYIVHAEKNDTRTMLDTVVMDIQSRKMLFRAPGTSIVKGRSTLINLEEQLRIDSINSFSEANDEMIQNLENELFQFKQKMKNNPEKIKVVSPKGYSGALGITEITLVFLITFMIRRKGLYKSNRSN